MDGPLVAEKALMHSHLIIPDSLFSCTRFCYPTFTLLLATTAESDEKLIDNRSVDCSAKSGTRE